MEIQEIIQQVDELKAEIDALRPISPEQEQRIMQKFRLDPILVQLKTDEIYAEIEKFATK